MDNIDRLIEAVEHPERYSETELKVLLSDPELKQLYRLMCATRADALMPEDLPDDSEVKRQWKSFKASRRRKNTILTWLIRRKVAAIIAFMIASCSIIVVGVSLSSRNMVKVDGSENVGSAGENELPDKSSLQVALPADTIIVFEDEKLDRVLAEIAPYYNVRVRLNSPASRDVRLFLKWDSAISLPDLIEQLNSFDRINLFIKDDVITDY